MGIRDDRMEWGAVQEGNKVTYTFRSRGPSNSTNITDCQVPSINVPADTGMVREGLKIEAAMCAQAWDGSCA